MIRKPDPPVIVAVTKEQAGRLKTTSAQILDYNLNRLVASTALPVGSNDKMAIQIRHR